MPTVLITEPIAESAVEVLKQKGFHVQFEYEKRNSDHAPEDVTAVINRLHPISDEWMAQYPNLKIIAYHGVGYDGIDTEAAKARGICVAITPGQNALGVAEHTMTLIMALSKQLVAVASDYKKDGFSCKYAHSYSEVADKTLGLIGLGNIGLRVANMARNGFAMHVIAYDKFPSQAAKDLGVEFVELDDLFARSDVLGLQMPLMDFNTGIINKENIAKMKDGVIIINNSRGQMVVEQDLADALNSGKVAFAGLDVVSTEPIRADNPLLTAKNCIITPHMSWGSQGSRQRIMDCTVNNIRAFLSGTPKNVVNP